MIEYSDELRDIFEAQYAVAHGLKPMQVKFQRAATGMYRDPEITRAARAFLAELVQRRAA